MLLYYCCLFVPFNCYIFVYLKTMESLEIYHVCVPPEKQIGNHEHPLWELSFVVRGKGQRTMCEETMPFYKNDLVLVPPDIPHHWTFDKIEDEIESITVQFSTGWLTEISRIIPESVYIIDFILHINNPIQILGSTSDEIRILLLRMIVQSDFEKVISLFSIFLLIAKSDEKTVVGRKIDAVSKRIEKIKTYIDCNYNHNLSIDDIAGYVGMNRSSLCIFFRKHTGHTIVDAINKRRLSVACNLLRNGGMTIREVCYMSGFNDYPYFCRLFKKKFLITPKKYQQSLNNNSSSDSLS